MREKWPVQTATERAAMLVRVGVEGFAARQLAELSREVEREGSSPQTENAGS